MQMGNNFSDFTLTMGGIDIPKTSSRKYLGVITQNYLKWDEHILNISGKANKTLGMVRRCLHGTQCFKTISTVYKTVVQPILEYACQVWSPHTQKLAAILEGIQRRAVRWIFKLQKLDSVNAAMQNHGISQLSERRDALDVLFLRKIEFGLYDIKLNNYVSFNSNYHTRGGTLNPKLTSDQFKYSFFNRIRDKINIKLFHPPTASP